MRLTLFFRLFLIVCCISFLFYAFKNEEQVKAMMFTAKDWIISEPIPESSFSAPIMGLTAGAGPNTIELSSVSMFGVVSRWRVSPSPNTVLSMKSLQPSVCWAFRGATGELIIYLPFPQKVQSISVEHIRPDTAKSAPKHFELFGTLEDGENIPLLANEYRAYGPAKQYFRIDPTQSDNDFRDVAFRVLSNQGNADYTCIYRVHLYTHDMTFVYF